MSKKYLIYSLAALGLLNIGGVNAYEREGCGGGTCNSGCGAPRESYGSFPDGEGPYYDHSGPQTPRRENRRYQGRGPDGRPDVRGFDSRDARRTAIGNSRDAMGYDRNDREDGDDRNYDRQNPNSRNWRFPEQRNLNGPEGAVMRGERNLPSADDDYLSANPPSRSRGWFNPDTVSMFKGEVVRVIPHHREGYEYIDIVLRTNQGDDIHVAVGDPSFLQSKNFVIKEGDKLDVKGSKVFIRGHHVIIAQEIKKDGESVSLRDKEGKALWKANRDE